MRAGALLLAILTAGCQARVDRFVVTPSHVCAGTPVKLEMRVAGTATVSIDPPLVPQASGTYVPQTTTRFVVAVTRWPLNSKAGSEAEVKVMPGAPAEADEITANVGCEGMQLVGTLPRAPEEWDPRLRVGTVTSGEDRELMVSHQGRQVLLTPTRPSTTVFDGTSPGGVWFMSSPLRSHERCGDTPAPPNLLNVSAEVRCGN